MAQADTPAVKITRSIARWIEITLFSPSTSFPMDFQYSPEILLPFGTPTLYLLR